MNDSPLFQTQPYRVLMLAPHGDETRTLIEAMATDGLRVCAVGDIGRLRDALRDPPGCLVLAAEALDEQTCEALAAALAAQPLWSDIPVIVLASPRDDDAGVLAERVATNLSLLQRPLRAGTLLTAVSAALRARRRQYALRDRLERHQAAERDVQRAQAMGHLGNWRLDIRRDVLTWSAETYRIFGIPERTPLTYERFLQAVHPDDRAFVDERWKACLRGEVYDIEHRIVVAGDVRWLRERAYMEFDDAGAAVGGFGIVQDITDLKQAEQHLREARDDLERRVAERTAELARRAEQLARLTSELTLVEQRERQRLAQVLHDHLQQLLAAGRFALDTLADRVGVEHAASVGQVHELLDEAIDASRSLTAELSPPILYEADLAAALQWLGRFMTQRYGLTVDVATAADAPPLPEEVKVLLFQSARELLFNVLKHAGVRDARVALAVDETAHLRLTVSDRGAGFDPARIDAGPDGDGDTTGFGLFTIRERLQGLGGRMEIDAAPGRGAAVTLVAPLGIPEAPATTDARPAATMHSSRPPYPGDRITVLLADDHSVMREGLAQFLSMEEDIVVIGQAADGQEAVGLAGRLHPDVVLMDFSMPVVDGVTATRLIHAEHPDIRIIGLSMYVEADRAEAMTDAGATAYLTKSGSTDVLLDTIRDQAPQPR